MSIIVLDPGHGGSQPIGSSSPNNATGLSGTLEKTLTLTIATLAAQALRGRGHSATLTRDTDVNLGLEARAALAKKDGADYFVSIHFNADGDPRVQGTETWIHPAASERTRRFASVLQRAITNTTQYRDRGVKANDWGVLRLDRHLPGTAACLLEVSFLTNPADEQRLADPAYRAALADAIAEAVTEHATAEARRAARSVQKMGRDSRIAGDPIEHVIVLMLENRSFDHMLGSVRRVWPDLDGIDPSNPGRNLDPADPGTPYEQFVTDVTAVEHDPRHELEDVLQQLDFGGERCGGFVANYQAAHGLPREGTREVMGYFGLGTLSVLHRLSAQFTVCDRWFSSVPGPTWTNRLFAHSGTSQGRVEMPHLPYDLNLHRYNQTTLYDRLNERGISWRIYFGDVPQSLVLEHQRHWRNARRYRRFSGGPGSDFFERAAGPADDFPGYAFIEPRYFLDQNDQHPPCDVIRGELLVARVYNALRANQDLWERSLFVVLYDEHGGFYDHVYPGPAVPPDEYRLEYSFDRYGIRVPALLISPWVAPGVLKTELDHTSLLRYLSDKWRLGELAERVGHANSFATAILPEIRVDTVEHLDEPMIPKLRADLASPRVDPPLNDLQRALLGLTEVLEAETVQPAEVKVARSTRLLEGPRSQAQVAAERVEHFLAQQRSVEAPPRG